jgi:hypothetical protein
MLKPLHPAGCRERQPQEGIDITVKPKPILIALGLFAVWMAATWLLEGRIETFRRPDAVTDRLVYTVVANILIGIVGAALVLKFLIGQSADKLALAGFGARSRTLLWLPLGFVLGLIAYVGQGAPSQDAIVILNAYAQVLVVSIAEVAVCWAVVAGILRSTLGTPSWLAGLVAALAGSILFGVYHFAHSRPFNSLEMVAFLTVTGFVTSAVFLVSRDIYGTIACHNFLAVFGVVQALTAGGQIESFRALHEPLIGTALVAVAVLVACDVLLIRRAVATETR